MSSGYTNRSSDAQLYDRLLRALEWLLPEPVTSAQVPVGQYRGDWPKASVCVEVGTAQVDCSPNGRSFRAFPNAESPRFLYPAGVPFRRFSALLRPRSRSIRKGIVSKVLASVPHLVEICSVPVVLATAHQSALSLLVQEFAEPENTAIYIGYRDGVPRPTIWGFDQRGKARTIAKYASGAGESASLHREYQTLRKLNQQVRFVGHVPVPHSYKAGHLGSMLVTDAFDGLPGPYAADGAVEQWLKKCVVGPDIAAGTSSLLRTLNEQAVELGGSARDAFAPAYEHLENAIVPTTIVHGDFTPWNILVDADSVRVFDWENAVLDGIPEWDRMFYIFRTGVMAQSWSSDQLVKEVGSRAAQGSEYYGAYAWKAILTLSLVHLLVKQPPLGDATGRLDSALSDLIRSWWT